jgi:Flp pilus assembly protein TadG
VVIMRAHVSMRAAAAVLRRRRRGAITVLAAFLMVFMLLFCAFAVDVGYLCVARTQAQRSADAAAMAATLVLVNEEYASGENVEQIHYTARAAAANYVFANPVGGVQVTADENYSNAADGDIVFGRIGDPADPGDFATSNGSRYNAVTVRVRRDENHGGRARLLFASILGTRDAEVYAEATAMFRDSIQGFRVISHGQNCSVMPLAVTLSTWEDWLDGAGDDDWAYDPDLKTVAAGEDGVREFTLFADGNDDGTAIVAGNFGTVDIGDSNNSAADLSRQIRDGPNADDLAAYGGVLKLEGTSNTLALNGDTGISASIQAALADIVGQPRTIMLYSEVAGQGDTATFTIVGFVGVRIVDFRIAGGNKYIRVQPAIVVDETTIASEDGSSWFVGQPVQLVR